MAIAPQGDGPYERLDVINMPARFWNEANPESVTVDVVQCRRSYTRVLEAARKAMRLDDIVNRLLLDSFAGLQSVNGTYSLLAI